MGWMPGLIGLEVVFIAIFSIASSAHSIRAGGHFDVKIAKINETV
jgi:hypothetical protein